MDGKRAARIPRLATWIVGINIAPFSPPPLSRSWFRHKPCCAVLVVGRTLILTLYFFFPFFSLLIVSSHLYPTPTSDVQIRTFSCLLRRNRN